MKTAFDLVVTLDLLLHEIDDRAARGSDIQKIACEAHVVTHQLAGLLSSDPQIQAAVAREQPPQEGAYWPGPSQP